MRVLLALALALVLLVALCSATLRLAGSGVGCEPWPACYAQANRSAPVPPDAAPAWQQTLRLTHRISATVAGLLFVFIVAFGFNAWSLSQRVAGVSLWLLAIALALVGRVTPSELPAVVLANLLGGHLLLAALAWLLTPTPRSIDAAAAGDARRCGWPLFAVVLVALASGGLVSARGAVAACADGCNLADWPAAWAALNPWQPNAAVAAAAQARGLLSLHAVSGLLAVAALGWAAWRLRRRSGVAWAALTLGLLAALAGLHVVQRVLPLPLATAHGLLGGLTLAAAAVWWRRIAR